MVESVEKEPNAEELATGVSGAGKEGIEPPSRTFVFAQVRTHLISISSPFSWKGIRISLSLMKLP
jgi:hypothetical protein